MRFSGSCLDARFTTQLDLNDTGSEKYCCQTAALLLKNVVLFAIEGERKCCGTWNWNCMSELPSEIYLQ